MKTKIKLHTGEKQAVITQDFQSLMEIVSLAFGSEGSEKPQVKAATSVEEVKAGFASVFG